MVTKTPSKPPLKKKPRPARDMPTVVIRIKARRLGGHLTHPSLYTRSPSKPSGSPALSRCLVAPVAAEAAPTAVGHATQPTRGQHHRCPPDGLGISPCRILRPPGLAGGLNQLTTIRTAPTSGQLGAPLLCHIRCAPGSSKHHLGCTGMIN
jgi:hypothetical protein